MIRITRRGFAALAGATVLARKALAQNDAAPLIERAIPSSGERLRRSASAPPTSSTTTTSGPGKPPRRSSGRWSRPAAG
jgi:hypothetical protein